MTTRTAIVHTYLRDFAELGINFWMVKGNWYWAKTNAPWVLGDCAPVHGPFGSAHAAGVHCAETTGKVIGAGSMYLPAVVAAETAADAEAA